LHVPEVDWIFLVDIYSKEEKDDLTEAKKKVLAQLAKLYKAQAVQAATKGKKEKLQ
jgi:hypothetical protein